MSVKVRSSNSAKWNFCNKMDRLTGIFIVKRNILNVTPLFNYCPFVLRSDLVTRWQCFLVPDFFPPSSVLRAVPLRSDGDEDSRLGGGVGMRRSLNNSRERSISTPNVLYTGGPRDRTKSEVRPVLGKEKWPFLHLCLCLPVSVSDVL